MALLVQPSILTSPTLDASDDDDDDDGDDDDDDDDDDDEVNAIGTIKA